MQNYTTQMDAARKGIVTPEMEIVAKKEYRTTEEIRQLVAEGKVAIPANKHHTCLNPEASVHAAHQDQRESGRFPRLQGLQRGDGKGDERRQHGRGSIMDLSSHGNTQPFRQKLTHECPVMIGTVPCTIPSSTISATLPP